MGGTRKIAITAAESNLTGVCMVDALATDLLDRRGTSDLSRLLVRALAERASGQRYRPRINVTAERLEPAGDRQVFL
jgi:hypothetical protein